MAHILRQVDEPNWHSFAPITAYDHAGYIWVTALYCLLFSSLVLLTRIWIKRFSWGHDDTMFSAAFAAQVGHVVAIFVALKNGLGRMPDSGIESEPHRDAAAGDTMNYSKGGQATLAAMILLILALALTKISLLLFMHRLMTSQSRQALRLSYGLIGFSSLWGLASTISIVIKCTPGIFITDRSVRSCKYMDRKWIGIATVDGLSELIIIAVPVIIVWPLKMSNSLKFQACSAFFFRLGVVAAAIVHVIYVAKYEKARHPSIAMVPAIIAAEAELCWSLVSAKIPNLKNFMKSFATGFGHEFGLGIAVWPNRAPTVLHAPKPKKIGSSIPLGRISRKIWHAERPSDFGTEPHSRGYATNICSSQDMEGEIRTSGGSSELIIRKDVTMSVDRSQKFGSKLVY